MSKSILSVLSMCSLSLAMTASVAFAGVGSSGGGKGVICRDSQGRIRQAMVLDLYEAVFERRLQLRPSAGTLDQDYAIYVQTIRRMVNDPRPVNQDVIDYLHGVLGLIHFTATGVHLPSTPDAGQVPAMPSGCRIEQIAIYHDNTNALEVDRELWNSLDSLNQAALFAHEEVYRNYRQAGDSTSSMVRSLVGSLFSTTPPTPQSQGIPSIYAECWANTGNPSTHDTLFDVYNDPSQPNSTSISFRRIAGRETQAQVKASFPVRFDLKEISRYKLPTIVSDLNANYIGSARIADGQFQGFTVSIRYQYGQPFALQINAPNGSLLQSANVDICYLKQGN